MDIETLGLMVAAGVVLALVLALPLPRRGARTEETTSLSFAAAAPAAEVANPDPFSRTEAKTARETRVRTAQEIRKLVGRRARTPFAPWMASHLTQSDWDEIVRLVDENPREALRRIDGLSGADRRNPLIRFARIWALGNLIWESVSGDFDMEAFLRGLSPEQKRLAEEGVKEIAALEREVPNFFSKPEFEGALNRVCLPHEFHHSGDVQRRLGWTKLIYWLWDDDRYFVLDRNDPDTEQLRDLPTTSYAKLIDARFTCPQTAVSSVLISARRTREGWEGRFILCSRKGKPGGKVRELNPFGLLIMREDGQFTFVSRSGAAGTTAEPERQEALASVARLNTRIAAISAELKSITEKLQRQ